jgi:hypothetical protein
MALFRPIARGIAAFSLVYSAASGAQEDPEAVYRKFHDATIAGNFTELRKWGTSDSANELAAMPAKERQEMIALVASMIPKSYAVTAKDVGVDKATLRLCARVSEQDKVETLPGTAELVKENGAWKVLSADWSGNQPSGRSAQECLSPVEPLRRATPPGMRMP